MDKSESIMRLGEALSKAQAIIKPAIKDSENPYFRATYADLASVWEACREPLTKNGLSIIQTTDIKEDKLILTTTLLHISGEFVSGHYPITPMKQVKGEGWAPSEDPQSLGSAITYARRYAMSAIVGIAPEDDDGETAMGRKQEKPKAIPSEPAQSNLGPVPMTDKQRAKLWATMKGDKELTDTEARTFMAWVQARPESEVIDITKDGKATKVLSMKSASNFIEHFESLFNEFTKV